MASILQCDHLRKHRAPYGFASERAELIYVNEQLGSLDRHISELKTLRHALWRHSFQLRNQLLPIHTLPIEVLSYIFQLAVDVSSGYSLCYQENLRRALVLSSVSSHFRHVAFDTPELWNKIPLYIDDGKAIGKVSSLLQHCIARAPNVTICVSDRYSDGGGGDLRSAIEILFTSDTTRKVKALELYSSLHASFWLSKINGSSFPIIETLIIRCKRTKHLSAFDFGTLNTMTRFSVYGPILKFPIIVPPSVQRLTIHGVSEQVFVSLLYQCPNLVDCSARILDEFHGPLFTEPLILNHLQRLDTRATNAITVGSSLRHLQLPSLEFLYLLHINRSHCHDILFCRNVSATLTTLIITTLSSTFDDDDLYQLWRSTFPKLRVLHFNSAHLAPLLSTFRALSPLDRECNNPIPLHLPALKTITLYSDRVEVEPRIFLDLLKNWWIDDALHLHFKLENYQLSLEVWTPALKEEFRLIVGSRQIEISWGRHKISHWHVPRSLPMAIE